MLSWKNCFNMIVRTYVRLYLRMNWVLLHKTGYYRIKTKDAKNITHFTAPRTKGAKDKENAKKRIK